MGTDPSITYTADGDRVLRSPHFRGEVHSIDVGHRVEVASDDLRALLLGEVLEILPADGAFDDRYLIQFWARVRLQDGEMESHPPRLQTIIRNGVAVPGGVTNLVRRFDPGRIQALRESPARNRGPRTDDKDPGPTFGRRARGRRR